MRTIKKAALLAVVAVTMASCAGIYRNLDLDCEGDRNGSKNKGIHFDIDASCDQD